MKPYHEPARSVIARTFTIAALAGVAFALRGGLARFPLGFAIALWPALGGHFVEVWFLNWLRPRIPAAHRIQVAARVLVWFAAGVLFALAMQATLAVMTGVNPRRWVAWWIAGLAFIGIELLAHAMMLRLRGRASFYDGAG